MKRAMQASLIAVVLCSTVFSFAKDDQYQTGKIVDVEKLAAKDAGASGSDTAVKAEVHQWQISVQVGDTIYKCLLKRYDPSSLNWTKGKEVQVRPKGNAMYLKKEDGSVVRATIVGKSQA